MTHQHFTRPGVLLAASLVFMIGIGSSAQSNVASAATAAPTAAATASGTPTATGTPAVPYLSVLLKADFPDVRLSTFGKFGNDNWQFVDDNGTTVACNDATTDYSGAGFGDSTWADYSVEIREKVVTWDTTNKNGIGVTFISNRVQFNNSGYVDAYTVWMNAKGGGLGMNVKNHDLAYSQASFQKDTWFTYRFEMQGNRLRYYLNGRLYLDVRDATYASGAAFVNISPGTSACFGSIVVRSLANSADALAAAPSGSITRSALVLASLDKNAQSLATLYKGNQVYILDTNSARNLTLIRIDKTGIQGWVPSDALGPLPTATPTKTPTLTPTAKP